MKPLNNKGSILVVVLVILYVLSSQSVSFSLLDISELNESRRYCRSVAAFWIAEAGINMYMKNPAMLDGGPQTVPIGGGSVYLTRDDSKPLIRLVNALATFQGTQKGLQISYSANVPEVYKNALSTKGDITVTGSKASVIINDKTRISGTVSNTSQSSKLFFEDKQESVDPSLTGLSDQAIQPDDTDSQQLQEFIQSNRDLIAGYPKDQVLYLTGEETYTINADTPLEGKKIIYVEGGEQGGNVVIESNEFLAENQNLTVISSGTVTFNQSGYQAPGSQLNIIAWKGYNETVSAPSINRGIIYTHGIAKFDQIKESSTTNGNVIADGGIEFGEVWSPKVFNYADLTRSDAYPPGFEKLTGASQEDNASLKPNLWRETM